MFPQTLLQAAQNTQVVVEVRSGQTYSGILINKDNYMNMNLKDVTIKSQDAEVEPKSVATCFIRGTQVKLVQITNETAQTSIDNFLAAGAALRQNLRKDGDDDKKPYNRNNNNDRDRSRNYNNNNNNNRGGNYNNNQGGNRQNNNNRNNQNRPAPAQ